MEVSLKLSRGDACSCLEWIWVCVASRLCRRCGARNGTDGSALTSAKEELKAGLMPMILSPYFKGCFVGVGSTDYDYVTSMLIYRRCTVLVLMTWR